MVTMVTESRVQILAGSCHSFPQCRIHILRLIQYLKIYLRTAHVAIYGKIWLSQLTNLPVAEKESLVGKLRNLHFREKKWQRGREKSLLFKSNFWGLKLPLNQQECKTKRSEKVYHKHNSDINKITIVDRTSVVFTYTAAKWSLSKEFLQLQLSQADEYCVTTWLCHWLWPRNICGLSDTTAWPVHGQNEHVAMTLVCPW